VGPNMEEAPPVWIDRVGFKANISEVCTMTFTSIFSF
jgi:hypothetical protein